jgi:hypothetical protein
MADGQRDGSGDEQGKWYYCLDHKTVEDLMGCRSSNRLGPYATREEAQNALQKVAERNAKWDEEDRLWNEAAPDNKKR